MSATALAATLAAVLLVAALAGPRVLQRAAPALAHAPRASSAALCGVAIIWTIALFALGPIVAWMSTGPSWLPQQLSDACDRCLIAATPFTADAVTLGIPAVIPMTLPLIGFGLTLAGIVHQTVSAARARGGMITQLRNNSQQTVLAGERVALIEDQRAYAFSLASRRGGIAISRGAFARLDDDELAAVIQHERAHLSQRHHLWLTLLHGATRYLRWVPLIRAVRAAVPHYLEIAADRVARERTCTVALAGALLKLGETPESDHADTVRASTLHAVLHANGSERVHLLIGQPRPPLSVAIAASVAAYTAVLVTAVSAVHWPYLLALVTGCE